ncbi:isoprenyl transferase [Virgisporangium aliadipatigenens]|uniref:Isoprenyl transferase n=1 Tax=Virgisporangium aliadipatigenens TaxID=741659 RepID=A0A8J3YL12_9ACTN|nr:isoprenyl transferase [Virgisporangium aliadipatigenens]GIJ47116.1 isoprenyl transferase [Virgisporangium aliadipatigenens]
MTRTYRPPTVHPTGVRPPALPPEALPRHVAVIMDGNGRWAKARGLPRTAGHERGEHALFEVVEGALEIGVRHVTAYAFSTENWRRSPDEVRFLMSFNRDTIHRRREELHERGVKVRWAGRTPRLWRSVLSELRTAEELTKDNDKLTLTMCINYGGRAEIADAAARLAADAAAGKIKPERITEASLAKYMYVPDMPDVDVVLRSSGENRLSNFLIWQAAYAEYISLDTMWPDMDRRHLWYACEIFAKRDRRFGGLPEPVAPPVV